MQISNQPINNSYNRENINTIIMTNWKEYKLGDIAEITTGFPFKGNKYTNNGIRVVRGENVTIGNLRWDTIKCWGDDFDQLEKYSLKAGDIVIGMDGSRVGKNRAQINKFDLPLLLAQRVACVRAKSGFSQDLIAYLIKSPKFEQYVEMVHTGTSIPHISQKQIEEFKVYLTNDLPTQTAIAEILSSLDDKIELNNKLNQELENLAQTLFKHWFIDFEFPNEKGEPYKSSGGALVDSELGEIPKGWEVKLLSEFVNCFDNKRIPLSSQERALRKGDYPYYGAASLMDYIDDYLFDGVYVLMGEDGSVTDTKGYPILQYVFGQFWVNNHAHVLQGSIISTELVMCLLKNTNISHLVTGAVQPKLNQGNMNQISLAIPNIKSILTNLEVNIKSIYESIRNNSKENQELTSLRDTLLPKLISGELEVSEVLTQTNRIMAALISEDHIEQVVIQEFIELGYQYINGCRHFT
jgi:type I restriction enzyme S subunit